MNKNYSRKEDWSGMAIAWIMGGGFGAGAMRFAIETGWGIPAGILFFSVFTLVITAGVYITKDRN